jgi:hypothetical protein
MDEVGRMLSLRDAEPGEFLATFPNLRLNLALTDGITLFSVFQFAGRGYVGKLAQGGTGPTEILQAGCIEEKAHAKNVGDGLASEIKNKVNNYSKSGFAVQPGTLKAGNIRAIDVAEDQVAIEGAPFLPCLLV